jgi:hypothetical protein
MPYSVERMPRCENISEMLMVRLLCLLLFIHTRTERTSIDRRARKKCVTIIRATHSRLSPAKKRSQNGSAAKSGQEFG